MSGILSSSMLYARDAVRHEAECGYLYISAPGYIFTQHEPSTEYRVYQHEIKRLETNVEKADIRK